MRERIGIYIILYLFPHCVYYVFATRSHYVVDVLHPLSSGKIQFIIFSSCSSISFYEFYEGFNKSLLINLFNASISGLSYSFILFSLLEISFNFIFNW